MRTANVRYRYCLLIVDKRMQERKREAAQNITIPANTIFLPPDKLWFVAKMISVSVLRLPPKFVILKIYSILVL